MKRRIFLKTTATRRTIIFVLIAATAIQLCRAQDYYFRHYDNELGLSHNTVTCSLQDEMGFVWFGTIDGLNRFDGHQFKTYRRDIRGEGRLKSNNINALLDDGNGKLWIGTDKGVCFYDQNTDNFGDIDSLFLFNEWIDGMARNADSSIWFVTAGKIFSYNILTHAIETFELSGGDYPHHICITRKGDIFVTSSKGFINKFDDRKKKFHPYPILNGSEKENYSGTFTLLDAADHGILIGTEGVGVKLFNLATLKTETVVAPQEEDKSIFVRTMLAYNENEFWLGTESGVYILSLPDKTITHLFKKKNDPYSLSDNAIYSIAKDNEGGIWVGTYFGGINYLPYPFTTFEKTYDRGIPGTIKGDAVREITQDKFGNLWIGTEDHGLNKYDFQTKQYINYIPGTSPGDIAHSNVHGILADGDSLWIGYFTAGIDVMDIQTGKVIRHYTIGKENDIHTNFVVKLYKTRNGDILAGTAVGLYRYDPTSDSFTVITDFPQNLLVYCIHEDRQGSLWIASLNAGLYCRQPDGKTIHYSGTPSLWGTSAPNEITDIFEDRENNLWLASRNNGLSCFDKKTKTITYYNPGEALSASILYKILDDDEGNLWISTSDGLVCYNPLTGFLKKYTKANGLMNKQFNYNSGYKDSTGKLYFGSIRGMTAFYPEQLRVNTIVPPIYITSFKVFNEELILNEDDGTTRSILKENRIVLPHNRSTFSIDFAALSYVSPETNEYSYMLDGVDPQWNNLRNDNTAHYTNLLPGKYTFRLKGSNGDGIWNLQEKIVHIEILTPWWRTTTAYIVYGFVILLTAYLLLKSFARRLKFRNELWLEKMQSMKDKELYNAKINFFTHIAHEIRTPLTLIKGALDRIIRSDNPNVPLAENITIMEKNTGRLLDLSNQLLDFRKTEQEGLKLNFTKLNLHALLENIYTQFTYAAKERNIVFRLEPMSLIDVIADKEALTKIITNLISNATKFAAHEISVSVKPDELRNICIIRVNSDGKEIPEAMKEKIFEAFFQYDPSTHDTNVKGTGIGLSLARSLTELHDGRLYLDKSVTEMNSFVLEIPLQQANYIDLFSPEDSCLEDIDKQTTIDQTLPTVLLVEDEPDMQKFITEELNRKYNVLNAMNGKEALDLLAIQSVSIIVSDINMPVMNGLELCERVKTDIRFSHTPLILLTAYSSIQAQIAGLESGANAYIPKPFSTEYLLAQIANLLKSKEQFIEAFNKSPLLYTSSVSTNKADENFINTVTGLIIESLSDTSLSVDTLAQQMGMSNSTFYRKVKGISNTTPNEFIRIIRLKKAAELLIKDSLSIKETAYLTGFSTPSYFTSSFTRQFGITPTEYIKNTGLNI